MRASALVFTGLALALDLAACGGTDVPPVPPAPPPTLPAPVVSVAPTAAAAPTVVATAAPTASAVAVTEPPKPASPCPPNMALVPGGTYTMARPKREVTTGAICMDLNETTADEYAACVKAGKCDGNSLKCAPQAT